jgi:hypothetical protein
MNGIEILKYGLKRKLIIDKKVNLWNMNILETNLGNNPH